MSTPPPILYTWSKDSNQYTRVQSDNMSFAHSTRRATQSTAYGQGSNCPHQDTSSTPKHVRFSPYVQSYAAASGSRRTSTMRYLPPATLPPVPPKVPPPPPHKRPPPPPPKPVIAPPPPIYELDARPIQPPNAYVSPLSNEILPPNTGTTTYPSHGQRTSTSALPEPVHQKRTMTHRSTVRWQTRPSSLIAQRPTAASYPAQALDGSHMQRQAENWAYHSSYYEYNTNPRRPLCQNCRTMPTMSHTDQLCWHCSHGWPR